MLTVNTSTASVRNSRAAKAMPSSFSSRVFIRRLQSQQLQTRAQQPDQAGGDAKYRFTQTHESWRDHADGRTMRPGRHASRAVPVSGG